MTGYQSKRAAAQGINWAEPDGRGAAAQEPVAWHHDLEFSRIQRVGWKPLYATPPQRTWVGLTKEDMPVGENPMFDHEYFIKGMVFAATILKEKNNG